MLLKRLLYAFIACIVAFVIYITVSDTSTSRGKLNDTPRFSRIFHDIIRDDDQLEQSDTTVDTPPLKRKAIQLDVGEKLIFRRDHSYLIIFDFNITVEPENDKRRQLITKYDSEITPPKGWAIALRKTASSTRMEFYLNDGTNPMGWLTFNALDVELNENNTYVFAVKPGDFISLFKLSIESPKKIQPLGVYSLGLTSDISSTSDLQISSGNVQHNKFRSNIDNIKILEITEFPETKKEFMKMLEKGNSKIFDNKNLSCLIEIPNTDRSCSLE